MKDKPNIKKTSREAIGKCGLVLHGHPVKLYITMMGSPVSFLGDKIV